MKKKPGEDREDERPHTALVVDVLFILGTLKKQTHTFL